MFSIAIFGRPLAGKVTLARAFAKAHGARAETFQVPIPGRADLADRGVRCILERAGVTYAIETFSGGVFNTDAWSSLIARASGVALVLDMQRPDEVARTQEILAAANPPPLGCIVLTKRDLIDDEPQSLELPFAEWPVFRTRADEPVQLIEPIEWLIETIRSQANA